MNLAAGSESRSLPVITERARTVGGGHAREFASVPCNIESVSDVHDKSRFEQRKGPAVNFPNRDPRSPLIQARSPARRERVGGTRYRRLGRIAGRVNGHGTRFPPRRVRRSPRHSRNGVLRRSCRRRHQSQLGRTWLLSRADTSYHRSTRPPNCNLARHNRSLLRDL